MFRVWITPCEWIRPYPWDLDREAVARIDRPNRLDRCPGELFLLASRVVGRLYAWARVTHPLWVCLLESKTTRDEENRRTKDAKIQRSGNFGCYSSPSYRITENVRSLDFDPTTARAIPGQMTGILLWLIREHVPITGKRYMVDGVSVPCRGNVGNHPRASRRLREDTARPPWMRARAGRRESAPFRFDRPLLSLFSSPSSGE